MSREAMEQIAELTSLAGEAINLAESIADRHGLEFDLDLGGYGMGGTYYSAKYIEEQGLRYREEGWNASSQSC